MVPPSRMASAKDSTSKRIGAVSDRPAGRAASQLMRRPTGLVAATGRRTVGCPVWPTRTSVPGVNPVTAVTNEASRPERALGLGRVGGGGRPGGLAGAYPDRVAPPAGTRGAQHQAVRGGAGESSGTVGAAVPDSLARVSGLVRTKVRVELPVPGDGVRAHVDAGDEVVVHHRLARKVTTPPSASPRTSERTEDRRSVGCAPVSASGSSGAATRTMWHTWPPLSRNAFTAYASRPLRMGPPKVAWNWDWLVIRTGVSMGPRR